MRPRAPRRQLVQTACVPASPALTGCWRYPTLPYPTLFGAAGEWAAKLQRYTSVEQKRVQPNPKRSDSPAVAVRTEGDAVLKALAPTARALARRVI